MQQNKDTKKLLEKCVNSKMDTQTLNICKILLEEMDRSEIKLEDNDESFIQMAQRISPEDVPHVLRMALELRDRPDIKDPEIKIAANRLIRSIESL
ncbi:hypothetical protein [Methanobacterium sp. ACI-7]|uniref:hypothetical protein n=1 Tax=unclassified Methanobacterium TaxID=2627676 RepID=UPI0039C32F0D